MGLESSFGRRRKKLIWAVEAEENESFDRPRCDTCSDRLRQKRGCHKPGFDVVGTSVFRSASPRFYSEDGKELEGASLKECPRSYVIRNAAHLFEAVAAFSFVEQAPSLAILSQSKWLQEAFAVIGSEKNRLRDLKAKKSEAERHARYGARARAGR